MGERAAFGSDTAYAARAKSLLLAFNFKFGPIKEIVRLCSLIISQNPRRNLYAPIYGIGLFIIVSLSFSVSFNIAVCLLFCHIISFVIKLFTAAQSEFNLDVLC